MLDLPYDFIKAKDEVELLKKLTILSSNKGFTYKIISIYPSGNQVVAWYYANRKT